ncbi:MAG: hypothetical protein OXB96_00340 [Candidatus Kaiserbacteria bacterium]|nr:hypothetical protein [Candidatus Kaiserbacteria bacterium]
MALRKNNGGGIALISGDKAHKVLRYIAKYDNQSKKTSSLMIYPVRGKEDTNPYILRKICSGKVEREEESSARGLKINFHTSGEYHISGGGFNKGKGGGNPYKAQIAYKPNAPGYYLSLAAITDHTRCPIITNLRQERNKKIDILFEMPPGGDGCVFIVFIRLNKGDGYTIQGNTDRGPGGSVTLDPELKERIWWYVNGFCVRLAGGSAFTLNKDGIVPQVLAEDISSNGCIYLVLCIPAIRRDRNLVNSRTLKNAVIAQVSEMGREVTTPSLVLLW